MGEQPILLTSRRQFKNLFWTKAPLTSFPSCRPALSTFALDVAIDRKDEHPFADLHSDIGKERKGLGASNFAFLLAEFVAAQGNQVLPQSLHHVDALRRFGQLLDPSREGMR